MSNPEQDIDRKQQILAAALHVIANEGYDRATIKAIAKQAGLKSPGLIYWYFENKAALLRELIAESVPLVKLTSVPEELMERPPEDILPLMAHAYLSSFDDPQMMQVFRIFLAEAARQNHELLASFYEGGARRVLDFFRAYLQHQIELGRLRPHNVESSTRIFVGSMLANVLMREILTPLADGLPAREEYVQTAVSIFLSGLRATDNEE
jgi:TetR/AcrR family transcriptional regulator